MNTPTPNPPVDSPRVLKAAQIMSEHLQHRIQKETWFKSRSADEQSSHLAHYTPERQMGMARRLIEAIENKHVGWLIEKNNGNFHSLWAAFTADTGVKLPKTQCGIAAALKAWAGEDAFNLAMFLKEERRRQRMQERESQDARHRAERITTAARAFLVSHNSATTNVADLVDSKLAEGWKVENISRSPIPRYALVNGDRFITIRDSRFSDYARLKASTIEEPSTATAQAA